jgi:hypothetical protein
LTFIFYIDIIIKNKYFTSYPERQRDWPYDARQPEFYSKVLIPARHSLEDGKID